VALSKCVSQFGHERILFLGLIRGVDNFPKVIAHGESWITEIFKHKFAVGSFTNTRRAKQYNMAIDLRRHNKLILKRL
jgi:hypothetical protein